MVQRSGDQGGAERLLHAPGEDLITPAVGFIDLHTHGLGDFDTTAAMPEHVLSMACLHGAAGTRAILPSIYPGDPTVMRRQMESVKRAMEAQDDEGGAVILGVHLEGPFLNPLRAGVLDKRSFEEPSIAAARRLMAGYEDIVRTVTVAPEIPGALEVIRMLSETGIRVNMGHSDASYAEALEGKKAGATGITHIFNAMRSFHHREPGIAGLGLLDEDLYIEVIADGYHLHPRTIEMIFRTKRMDRIILVSDSIKGPRSGGRPFYREAGVLSGSSITIADSLSVLKEARVPEAAISETSVDNPARYLNLSL